MRIAREGLPIAAVPAILSLAAGLLLSAVAAVPGIVLLVFVLWFFRDPERTAPGDPDALLSPADGKVIKANRGEISVFMNIFNVHVCRAPMAGAVTDVSRRRGRFLAAYRDAASLHNERTSIGLQDGARQLTFTLVAGLIARRIVCRIRPGQRLSAGERIGLIRFGSRVDLSLPPGARPVVRLGERVVAGESIVARLESISGPPSSG
jgi:phosphatidylserine decarboxylase